MAMPFLVTELWHRRIRRNQVYVYRILKNKREVKRRVMLQTPFEQTRMDAHLQQVNMLLLEQKSALMQQEKEHQRAILERRKVAKWECSKKGIVQLGTAEDPPNVLTPRMSFEQQLTDDMLKRLLEKHCFLLVPWASQGGSLFNFSPALKNILKGGLNMGLFWSTVKSLLCSNVNRRATAEAMVLLFREELDETFRMTRELLEGMGSHVTSTGLVKRQELYAAMQRTDKQDMAFVMQTIPGNDLGEVEYEALPTLLHILRRESINNAVLEVDSAAIEAELNRTATELHAEQKYQDSREFYAMRVHPVQVLLCLSPMNRQGQVDWEEFVTGESPDRESVEKTLVHLFTVLDDRRKGSVPAQVFVGVMHYWSARSGTTSSSAEASSPPPLNSVSSLSGGAALAAERRYADIVMSCRLTPAEVTGFVAEAKVDPVVQEISYTEHIKAWVATIFEIRRSHFWYSVSHNSFDDGKVFK
ncbi:hypothetical protein, conserved [Eimeria praecox]|uniref:EF-hand domain-containing protein n=1 Tax=Eimeria praecox TaxID=51316 RepID=U6G8R2_9EIME|nr:hypothetical protein, conserved [Eimeria praecox]